MVVHKSALRLIVLGTLATAGTSNAAFAETRSYSVNWFHTAAYRADDTCPNGINLNSGELIDRVLKKDLGWDPEKADKLVADGQDQAPRPYMKMRGRIDGKPANVYVHPTSVPDPKIKTVEGKFAYGFNLDGKIGAQSFEDPETHEKGVDNELYRALGCFQNYYVTAPDRPGKETTVWQWMRDTMPAWLVTISGDDLSKDGEVSVTFNRALHIAKGDGSGDRNLFDQSFIVDDDPRSHHVVKGRISDGVIIAGPFDFSMIGDPTLDSNFTLKDAQLRLKIGKDRAAQGFIGGYRPWYNVYMQWASQGSTNEAVQGLDIPGMYYALRRLADHQPDESGQNQLISATYRMELAPAIIAKPATVAAPASSGNLSQ